MRYPLGIALLFASVTPAMGLAQDLATATTPRVDFYVGVGPRFDSPPRTQTGRDQRWRPGIEAGAAINFGPRLALVTDDVFLGRNTAGAWGYGFAMGPGLRFGGRERKLTGFAQPLMGPDLQSGSGWVAGSDGPSPVANRSVALQTSVAAGLDLRLSRRVSWRVVQVKQWHRFGQNGSATTGATTGLVFGLGGR